MNPLEWLNPGRWLLYGAFIAALALGIWRLDESRQAIGYARAQAEYAKQAEKADEKRDAVEAPIAEKQEVAQVRIRTITKTIIEKVPVYVKADDCPMPGGFRLLHDAAAANVEVSESTAIADAAPVPARTVAETVVSNYGTCHATAARLVGLQEWINVQRALK